MKSFVPFRAQTWISFLIVFNNSHKVKSGLWTLIVGMHAYVTGHCATTTANKTRFKTRFDTGSTASYFCEYFSS